MGGGWGRRRSTIPFAGILYGAAFEETKAGTGMLHSQSGQSDAPRS